MIDARSPWIAGSSSRTDLECTSSTSVLQSIYGSQVSQLHFTESESDTSLIMVADEYATSFRERRSMLRRPKSSPASAILSREQQRARGVQRPGTALTRPVHTQPSVGARQHHHRPASAVTRIVLPLSSDGETRRPQHRPASALPTTRVRPATAFSRRHSTITMARPSSASRINQQSSSYSSSSSTVQLRDTAPVSVSSTAQYFGFWNEKPILKREFVKPVHSRKKWRRPSSGLGSNGKRKTNEGEEANSGGNIGLLTTLDEIDSLDGTFGSNQRRTGIDGREGEEEDGGGWNKNDKSKGEGEGDDDRLRGNQADGSGWKSSHLNGLDTEDGEGLQNGLGKDGEGHGIGMWSEGEEYFKSLQMRGSDSGLLLMDYSSGHGNTTRFSLPIDLQTLERMTPTDYLHSHCIISFRRTSHYNKIFKKADKNRDGRLSLTELLNGVLAAHYHCLKSDQAHKIAELMALDDDVLVDEHLFGAACVLAERLFPECLPFALQKEIIEVADFQALEWKLRTCSLSRPLHALLSCL